MELLRKKSSNPKTKQQPTVYKEAMSGYTTFHQSSTSDGQLSRALE